MKANKNYDNTLTLNSLKIGATSNEFYRTSHIWFRSLRTLLKMVRESELKCGKYDQLK